jgi:hypothetical protein
MESVEESGLWRRTALRQHHQIGKGCFAIQVGQNSLDHRRIFNASDDLDLTTAPLARLRPGRRPGLYRSRSIRSSDWVGAPSAAMPVSFWNRTIAARVTLPGLPSMAP